MVKYLFLRFPSSAPLSSDLGRIQKTQNVGGAASDLRIADQLLMSSIDQHSASENGVHIPNGLVALNIDRMHHEKVLLSSVATAQADDFEKSVIENRIK